MLKIKDNVDLRDLEKYGFKFDQYQNEIVVCFKASNSIFDLSKITFYKDKRVIDFDLQSCCWCNDIDELEIEYKKITNAYKKFKQLIDDLIKADLVERVESDD